MSLTPQHCLALALDPTLLFEARGLTPDPWQSAFLRSKAQRILLNCCRQAGKSTVVAALALHTILFRPSSLVLLLSRAQRQSAELFRTAIGAINTELKGTPFARRGLLIRPAACSAYHGLSQGLTPASS